MIEIEHNFIIAFTNENSCNTNANSINKQNCVASYFQLEQVTDAFVI